MPELVQPLVAAGLFLGAAKLYAVSKNIPVPTSTQLIASGLLGASTYVAQYSTESNSAVQALTAGSVFAGSMYFVLDSKAFLTYAVVGTASAYIADVLTTPSMPVKQEDN